MGHQDEIAGSPPTVVRIGVAKDHFATQHSVDRRAGLRAISRVFPRMDGGIIFRPEVRVLIRRLPGADVANVDPSTGSACPRAAPGSRLRSFHLRPHRVPLRLSRAVSLACYCYRNLRRVSVRIASAAFIRFRNRSALLCCVFLLHCTPGRGRTSSGRVDPPF
jgi:hypothetical protein